MKQLLKLAFYAASLVLSGALHANDRAGFAPKSMAYVLQADKLVKTRNDAVQTLAESSRDLIVLDASYNTGQQGSWTTHEIDTIRTAKLGRKVVAYISIGEAEDYRPYWQASWDENKDGKPDEGAPAFLNVVNPDWEGNYKVRYWDKSWQSIILKSVEVIIEQGFDGVYLDIVDAFEFYEYDANTDQWEDNRKNPEFNNTYRQDMVAWVNKIAGYARKAKPNFLVIPQNGAQLLSEPEYLKTIDAIGIEDLFTSGNRMQAQEDVSYVSGLLKHARRRDKPIFLIEYGSKPTARDHSIQSAESADLMLLLTDRELSTLGVVNAPLK